MKNIPYLHEHLLDKLAVALFENLIMRRHHRTLVRFGIDKSLGAVDRVCRILKRSGDQVQLAFVMHNIPAAYRPGTEDWQLEVPAI